MGDLLGSPRVASLLFVSLSPLLTRAAASLVLCRPLGEGWGESDVTFSVETRAAASLVLCRPLGEGWGESDVTFSVDVRGYIICLIPSPYEKVTPILRNDTRMTPKHVGCDHTSTKAPDPIRTPKLSVLGRE